MSYVKTWKCKNCGTPLTWKLPYEQGKKPFEYITEYGKIKYTKEHYCKRQKINELPKVFVPDTPNFLLCGECNKGTELVSCEYCFFCKELNKPSYCLECKTHPKLLYYSNSKYKILN